MYVTVQHGDPRTQEQQSTILDVLNHTVVSGDKLFTGETKENLDMMFTMLLKHGDPRTQEQR